MKRSARLQSAVCWLKNYDGNNLLRGYCKHFGVDWRCAAIELKQLGASLDEGYLQRRAESEQQLVKSRQKQKEEKASAQGNFDWPPHNSAFEAYLAGDFAAVHALENTAQSHGMRN